MEEVVEGLETSTKGGSNIKKPHLGWMRKNKKTINAKGLCFPTMNLSIDISNAQKDLAKQQPVV
jgi:hypothetical protein